MHPSSARRTPPVVVALALLVLIGVSVMPASAGTVVPRKTTVELELLENVNSKLNQTGEVVSFAIAEDVIVDGHVVFEQGTPVEGRIKFAQPSKSNGRAGTLQIVVPRLPNVRGEEITMFGEVVASGKNRSDSAAVGAIVAGSLFLTMKGRQAFHLKGEIFEIVTRNEEALDPDAPPGLRTPPEGVATAVVADREGTGGTAGTAEQIDYMPRKGKLPEEITLTFVPVEGREAPQQVEIAEVDGLVLPQPLPATEVQGKKLAWEAVFESWPLVRYMRGTLEGRANEVAAVLRFADGEELPATASVVVELELKQK